MTRARMLHDSLPWYDDSGEPYQVVDFRSSLLARRTALLERFRYLIRSSPSKQALRALKIVARQGCDIPGLVIFARGFRFLSFCLYPSLPRICDVQMSSSYDVGGRGVQITAGPR